MKYPVIGGGAQQESLDATLVAFAVKVASGDQEAVTPLEKAGMLHVRSMPADVFRKALDGTPCEKVDELVCNNPYSIEPAAVEYTNNHQDIDLGILVKLNAYTNAKENGMENRKNYINGYLLALAKIVVNKPVTEMSAKDWGVLEAGLNLPVDTTMPATALLQTASAADTLMLILEQRGVDLPPVAIPVDPARKLKEYQDKLGTLTPLRDPQLDQAIYTQMGVEDEDEALVRIARALNDASTDKAVDTIASDAGSTVTEVSAAEAVTAARQAPKTFAAEAVTAASAGNGWADLPLARERTGSVSGGTSSDGMSGWAIAGLAVAGAAVLYGGYRFFSEGEVEDVELVDLDDAF